MKESSSVENKWPRRLANYKQDKQYTIMVLNIAEMPDWLKTSKEKANIGNAIQRYNKAIIFDNF